MKDRRLEKFEFPGARGQALAARLDQPVGELRGYALFAHCFTCTKDIYAAARISVALAERGIAVVRFDFTGLGSSEGEFANTNFSSNVEDLLAAADHLRDRGHAPQLLIGHSLGGAAVLAAASEVPEVVAVVSIAAPSEPAHVRGLLHSALPEVEARGETEVQIGGRSFRVRKQFFEDLANHSLLEKLGALKENVLIFHAPDDEVVPMEHAYRLFEAAAEPKSLVSLPGANHLLTRRQDAQYVAEVISAWSSHVLP